MGNSFYIKTLGCKVNQYNSQFLRENLGNLGLKEIPSGYFQIINGCMVTKKAERKTRKLIYKALEQGEEIVLTGCYARGENYLKTFLSPPDINRIVSIPEENKVVSHITGRKPTLSAISSFHSHTRAFVKIQEGCPHSCSYCIVPQVRGKIYSRKEEDILKELELLNNYYPEIVLTGTHLGLYKNGNTDFSFLLEKILHKAKNSRIRLSSIEINEVTPSLLSLFNNTKLCPHLHIPLQSGSNKILKLMRRAYTRNGFLKTIEKARQFFPQIAFTTDIIVGFPTEEDKDFKETLDLVEKVGFSRIHIFPYSLREKTDAAKLTPMIPEIIKRERIKKLEDLASGLSFNFRRHCLGENKKILLEHKKKNDKLWGYTEDYIPVQLEADQEAVVGKIYPCIIIEVNKSSTSAILIKNYRRFEANVCTTREKRKLLPVCKIL